MSEPIINLTTAAVKQLLKIRTGLNVPDDHVVRVGVKGGGCSGVEYVLGFDQLEDNDDIFEVSGVKVCMNKAHVLHLLGIEIDWIDDGDIKGFSFNNSMSR